jgi:GT2 family glycosyltransferase
MSGGSATPLPGEALPHYAVGTCLPRISVVIVSHNEGDLLCRTVHDLLATLPAYSELLVVDDCSTDGSVECVRGQPGVQLLALCERLGVSRARNFGAAAATGEAIVFSDAHVETPRGWATELLSRLAEPRVGMVGPALSDMGDRRRRGYGMTRSDLLAPRWLRRLGEHPYPVPMLCGAFTGMRRDVLLDCGGFDDHFMQYGSEDTELSLRLWSLGYECLIVPTVEVAHLFRDRHPYAVDAASMLHNRLRIAAVRFDAGRRSRFHQALAADPSFAEALALLECGDAPRRRAALEARRRRTDEWHFGTWCTAFEAFAA